MQKDSDYLDLMPQMGPVDEPGVSAGVLMILRRFARPIVLAINRQCSRTQRISWSKKTLRSESKTTMRPSAGSADAREPGRFTSPTKSVESESASGGSIMGPHWGCILSTRSMEMIV